MKPMRVAALVLVALAVGAQASPEKRGSERDRPKEAEKGPAAVDEKEALYAMGAILGAKINGYRLSPKELQIVERGFADAAANRKLMLRDADLDEWGPKVEAVLARRSNPQVAAEKDRGRKVAERTAKEPGGPQPAATDRVRVKYEGRLADGKSFDSSDGAEFPLNQVIPCWTEGVQRIKVGGKARLVCPSATAYGDQGRPPQIPPGATLVFIVELLGIGK